MESLSVERKAAQKAGKKASTTVALWVLHWVVWRDNNSVVQMAGRKAAYWDTHSVC
jgi:hypothetical protein